MHFINRLLANIFSLTLVVPAAIADENQGWNPDTTFPPLPPA